ncbi:hypothetical protein BGV40_16830 [Methanosarcina sp. Ant1]|nr:hypothetical protein BGV40_16830 [Methanosarcina sp. Ant1]
MSHLSASLLTVRSRDWKVDLRICGSEASECGIREMSRQPKPWIENVTDDLGGLSVFSLQFRFLYSRAELFSTYQPCCALTYRALKTDFIWMTES